jgi:hypothetical protein
MSSILAAGFQSEFQLALIPVIAPPFSWSGSALGHLVLTSLNFRQIAIIGIQDWTHKRESEILAGARGPRNNSQANQACASGDDCRAILYWTIHFTHVRRPGLIKTS